MADKIYLATRDDVLSMGSQIAPIVKQEIDDCYDAIELKGGLVPETEEDKNLKNLPQAVESIQDRMSMFVSPDYDSEITIDSQRVRDYAFTHMTISEFNAPNLTEIGNAAFSYCNFLGSYQDCLNIPEVSVLPDYCFERATWAGTSDLTLNGIKKIGRSCFSWSKLRNVSLPDCEDLGQSAFENSSVKSITCPKVIVVGQTALNGCDFTTIDLPNAKTFAYQCMANCPNLVTVNIGAATNAPTNAVFGGQSKNLSEINFTAMNVDTVFSQTFWRNGLITTAKFNCIGGTIEYIGGSWQIVRD